VRREHAVSGHGDVQAHLDQIGAFIAEESGDAGRHILTT
jgi:hypothetical protein